MKDRTEKDPRFRTAMYALIACLLLGYIVMKAWHINLAVNAFEGQELDQSKTGAAK